IVGVLFVVIAFVLICEIDSLVLQCTEAFFPGYGAAVCVLLIVLEASAVFMVYRALFGRPSRLLLKPDATLEERKVFCAVMSERLKSNSYVAQAGIAYDDPHFLEKAMDHLDSLADKEIRSHGRKVFLGTALSQNGRLDALIVFFSLCRMIWRISGIYNQKPTADEFLSVCSTVSSSTFVAFSIDALNIPQTITDSMHELVPSVTPAVATSSVPFVGSALHVFTQALIDGAANSLLVVRSGVITKRAYRYAMQKNSDNLRVLVFARPARLCLIFPKNRWAV
ncbi:MAG: hypothetical protein IK079_03840, partial [Desulfovibrio sp.]|nr:hypothetical protein [Desulfovibrio sp.]